VCFHPQLGRTGGTYLAECITAFVSHQSSEQRTGKSEFNILSSSASTADLYYWNLCFLPTFDTVFLWSHKKYYVEKGTDSSVLGTAGALSLAVLLYFCLNHWKKIL
jgi:hypothetical protein